MKAFLLIISIFTFLIHSVLSAAVSDSLCPPLEDRSIRLRDATTNQIITAPASPGEAKALIGRLLSGEQTERNHAIMALALGGNIEAFRYLLNRKDPALSLYSLNYQNNDGTRCVDPEIEKAIIQNLDTPSVSRALQAFLAKNLYRSQRLFEALRAQKFDARKASRYTEIVRSLTATNLPVEREVLDAAQQLPDHTTPRLGWIMPEIQQAFIKYFGRRRYEPASDYMEAILNTGEPPGIDRGILSRYSQTRLFIYKALDGFGSDRSRQILIGQLGRFSNTPRDAQFQIELHQLGEHAVRNARSDDDREAIVRHLGQFLDREMPVQGKHASRKKFVASEDLKLRKTTYRLLVSVGTASSADVLIDELGRLNRQKLSTGTKRTLTLSVLDALRELPEDTGLDVPRFLKSLDLHEDRDRWHVVPDILVKHPHPEGYRYLVGQLEWILDHREGLHTRYGQSYDVFFSTMFQTLSVFDNGRYRKPTRNELDRLYRLGKLDEELYVSFSEKLNAELGTESPQYLALIEQRKRERDEKRARELEQKRSLWQKKFNDQIAEHTSPEGIKKNIRVLSSYGREAKIAGMWLVAAGPDILPSAHEALQDPSANMKLKLQLISVLSIIGDPRSIEPIIETVKSGNGNDGIYKEVFLALGQMPQTEASFTFASKQLSRDRPPVIQRSALMYFALQRDQRARQWAEKFSSSEAHLDVRYAGLFLAAMLGDEQAKTPITELLRAGQERSVKEVLMRSLAELAGPEDFQALASQLKMNHETWGYTDSLRYAEFRHARGEEKIPFAEELLRSRYHFDRRLAIRYLIKEHNGKPLVKHFRTAPYYGIPIRMVPLMSPLEQLIMNEARRMGYRIDESPEGIHFTKTDME